MNELDAQDFTPDPYHRRLYCTAGLVARMRSLASSLRVAEAMEAQAGFAAGAAKLRRALAALHRKLRRVDDHNLRTERKYAMLRDAAWRARVRDELGGDTAMARWRKAWARRCAGLGAERAGRERAPDADATRRPAAKRDARREFRLAPIGRAHHKPKGWARQAGYPERERDAAAQRAERPGVTAPSHMWGRGAIAVWPSELEGGCEAGETPPEVLETVGASEAGDATMPRSDCGNVDVEAESAEGDCESPFHPSSEPEAIALFQALLAEAEGTAAPHEEMRPVGDQAGLSEAARPAGWAVFNGARVPWREPP